MASTDAKQAWSLIESIPQTTKIEVRDLDRQRVMLAVGHARAVGYLRSVQCPVCLGTGAVGK